VKGLIIYHRYYHNVHNHYHQTFIRNLEKQHNSITITIPDITYRPVFYLKTWRFGDWTVLLSGTHPGPEINFFFLSLIIFRQLRNYSFGPLSWVEVVTDGQSAYPSWCQAPPWESCPDFFSFLSFAGLTLLSVLGRLFWREDGSEIFTAICRWSYSQSQSHFRADSQSISQSECLGVEPTLLTFDQILLHFQEFGSGLYCPISVGRPLWREAGSVHLTTVI
jgi:hypothetical protein